MNGRHLVAWNLRRLRVQRDISQEALGLEAGVDRTYVGRLERSLENPTVGVLDKLSAALEVHISLLFHEPQTGEAAPKPLRGGRRSRRFERRSAKRRISKR
jgi:transcriptional regulator with XRE-family HTH domain